MAAALGITLAEFTAGTPQLVACSVTTLMEIISIIQSVHTVADSAGGIYSTAMGEGNKYDKAEAFAHDATMLAVSLIFLWGTVSLVKNCTSLFRSASQNLIGRTSRPTASEVTQTYKGAKMLASFEEFTKYTKGFLDALWNAVRVIFFQFTSFPDSLLTTIQSPFIITIWSFWIGYIIIGTAQL